MRAFVLGLDCAAPQLVFERLWGELPNLRSLAEGGRFGVLRSCDPPITIPAWAVMFTGMTPGELGLYGFRHRRGFSYDRVRIADSRSVPRRAVWDELSRRGRPSVLIGVPSSWPPFPLEGCLISCFLTPHGGVDYTWPPELRREVEALVGRYRFDVEFRTEDRDRILAEVYEMSERRFRVAEHLLRTRPWDLFVLVEIGLDRLHHAFWKFLDPSHPRHQPGRYSRVIPEYYRWLDERLGRLLGLLGDDTAVLVVSDHGAKAMKGAFCLNEYLVRRGYLALRDRPAPGTPLERAPVDWSRTRAWAWGGYYARVFLNVRGREPQGVIPPEDYERERRRLAEELCDLRGPNGEPWNTRVLLPEEHYGICRGDPPDLMVYLDDLCWRSAGTLGHPGLYLPENDTGPDDAVHAKEGMFVLWWPHGRPGGRAEADILDIAPTLRSILGLEAVGSHGVPLC